MFCGLFVSCDTPEETTPTNPLVGTLWVEEDNYPVSVEFTGDNTVSLWGGYHISCSGTYKIQGNNVVFTLKGTDSHGLTDVYKTGMFTNNTLRITYHTEYYDDENNFKRTKDYKLILYKR